jgi:hypothetical protein
MTAATSVRYTVVDALANAAAARPARPVPEPTSTIVRKGEPLGRPSVSLRMVKGIMRTEKEHRERLGV